MLNVRDLKLRAISTEFMNVICYENGLGYLIVDLRSRTIMIS